MVLTIDFENETVTSEQGTMIVPGIKDKESEVLKILGLEKISSEELKADINNLFSELGFTDVKA